MCDCGILCGRGTCRRVICFDWSGLWCCGRRRRRRRWLWRRGGGGGCGCSGSSSRCRCGRWYWPRFKWGNYKRFNVVRTVFMWEVIHRKHFIRLADVLAIDEPIRFHISCIRQTRRVSCIYFDRLIQWSGTRYEIRITFGAILRQRQLAIENTGDCKCLGCYCQQIFKPYHPR